MRTVQMAGQWSELQYRELTMVNPAYGIGILSYLHQKLRNKCLQSSWK